MKLRAVIDGENGYSILKARVKGYDDLVTLVGNMLDVTVGTVLVAEGQWKVNRLYGSQFVVETYEEAMPATLFGLEKYLGSGLVKGIGPKFSHHREGLSAARRGGRHWPQAHQEDSRLLDEAARHLSTLLSPVPRKSVSSSASVVPYGMPSATSPLPSATLGSRSGCRARPFR